MATETSGQNHEVVHRIYEGIPRYSVAELGASPGDVSYLGCGDDGVVMNVGMTDGPAAVKLFYNYGISPAGVNRLGSGLRSHDSPREAAELFQLLVSNDKIERDYWDNDAIRQVVAFVVGSECGKHSDWFDIPKGIVSTSRGVACGYVMPVYEGDFCNVYSLMGGDDIAQLARCGLELDNHPQGTNAVRLSNGQIKLYDLDLIDYSWLKK